MTAARALVSSLVVAAALFGVARSAGPATCRAATVAGRAAAPAAAGEGKAPSRCTDPGVQAVRGEYKACVSSAAGAFAEALDGCLARDHECVSACRWRRWSCREATGIGTGIAACRAERERAQDQCRRDHALGSTRRAACLHQARAEDFQCRRRATRRVRRDLVGCARTFRDCAGACAPGQPPDGVASCKAAGRSVAQAQLRGCKRTFQAAMSASLDKDLTCGLDCADARAACTAPTSATLDAALAACRAQEQADVAGCVAANPGGGAALDGCVLGAQSAAWSCRDAATAAAAPGLAACVPPYVACVRACPPA